jgi:hypothetical protein
VELDERVDDALAVHDDLDAVHRDVEQPVRFDHLEALVHERGRVDGDLAAHIPRRVTQRVTGCHVLEVARRQVAERAAGGRENEFLDGGDVLAPKALPDGAVLAVDGAQFAAVALRLLSDDGASHDEHFLVGERDSLAGAEGGDRRPRPARR